MDSSTRLDHALFQLTPTRTRCDLVIFASGKSEKLASGLLEPFLSHLRFAKELIPKGGYSITLSPPESAASNAIWFTKGTLERFVRFVSTPEVLERFVTIEREILQIENSIQSIEPAEVNRTEGNGSDTDGISKNSTAASKSKGDSDANGDTVLEENSKVRLQRVLESRKAVLRKEQAMAYARALVAGFEMDHIDDLITFADVFGASRLREACLNFLELCKKKHEDGIWMDELASMQASQAELSYLGTSGIVLASENSNSGQNIMLNFQNGGLFGGKTNSSGDASVDSSLNRGSSENNQAPMAPADGKAQIPVSWPNHVPQYMHNFQGPMYPQVPPYQGYFYHGMQVGAPYYPGNPQWPLNREDSGFSRDLGMDDHISFFRNKGRHSNVKGRKNSVQDDNTNHSNSSSGSDSDDYLQHEKKLSSSEQHRGKKHGKKTSRKVVIRNINYITSKRNGDKGSTSGENSSDEDEYIDGNSLKQQVEEAVGSLERRHKSNSRHHKKKDDSEHISSTNGFLDAEEQEPDNEKDVKGKTNENWGAFQNLLMREREPNSDDVQQHPIKFQDEHFTSRGFQEETSSVFTLEQEARTKPRALSSDSFLLTGRDSGYENKTSIGNFENDENARLTIKTKGNTDEELLFSQRLGQSGNYAPQTLTDSTAESSSIIRSQNGEDWFLGNQTNKSDDQNESIDLKIFEGHYASSMGPDSHIEPAKKDPFIDDSIMIQTRSFVDDQLESQLRTDLSLVLDIVGAKLKDNNGADNSLDKYESSGTYEPDDLCMVLDRDSAAEQAVPSWTPELEYEYDITLPEDDKRLSVVEANAPLENGSNGKDVETPEKKALSKEIKQKGSRIPGKNKPDIISRTKRPNSGNRTVVQKSKSEKEEENRKRMEELLIQRQKRIAERSAASGATSLMTRRSPLASKTGVTSVKLEKPKTQTTLQETKPINKPVLRSSTIDRLATARTNPKVATEPKSAEAKKVPSNGNGMNSTTPTKKAAGADKKKPSPKPAKPSDGDNGLNEVLSVVSDVRGKDDNNDVVAALSEQSRAVQNAGDSSEEIKEVRGTSSIEKTEVKGISLIDNLDNGICNENTVGGDSSVPSQEHILQNDYIKCVNGSSLGPCEDKTIPIDHVKEITNVPTQPFTSLPTKVVDSVALNFEDVGEANEKFVVSPEISEIEVSTPPPDNGFSPEPTHYRKKWNSGENSPKASKGFRKLLMFVRKSGNSPASRIKQSSGGHGALVYCHAFAD
ncbi:hypothetical protein RJ641_000223, partial [Dillenia turbinata]